MPLSAYRVTHIDFATAIDRGFSYAQAADGRINMTGESDMCVTGNPFPLSHKSDLIMSW